MSTVGFPLKMENGIQMLGCPDIFLFFSQIFFGIFLQSISWKWQFGHFFSHVSKFIPWFIYFLKHWVSIFITIDIFLIFALTPLAYNQV